MSAIDIRAVAEGNVDEIIFSDVSYGWASRLVQVGDGDVRLADTDRDREADVQAVDVPNLILALQKAQELGWC